MPNKPKTEKEKPYAVVFSGGGALGSWEVGCLRALRDHHDGQLPDIVTGASAGALNAAAIFCGYSVDELENLWKEISSDCIFKFNIALSSVIRQLPRLLTGIFKHQMLRVAWEDFSARTPSIFDTSPFYSTLSEIFGNRQSEFDSSCRCLAICMTDLERGGKIIAYRAPTQFAPRSKEWEKIGGINKLVDALMGTTALPILFPPVRKMIDGGVLRNQPIGPAIDFGASQIYVLIPNTEKLNPIDNIAQAASATIQTWLSMSLYWQIDVTNIRNK